MPYIKQVDRPEFDQIVELMKEKQVKGDGSLWFILFEFCRQDIKASYNNYKNFRGELLECSEEIKRRLLPPDFSPLLRCLKPKKTKGYTKILALLKEKVKVNGDLNYILFKVCRETCRNTEILHFSHELMDCHKDIGQKLLAPYENEKIIENGDV